MTTPRSLPISAWIGEFILLAALWGSLKPPPRWAPKPTGPQGPYAEQAEHVNTFLHTFKASHGDLSATVARLPCYPSSLTPSLSFPRPPSGNYVPVR